jgi:hypothetical protein
MTSVNPNASQRWQTGSGLVLVGLLCSWLGLGCGLSDYEKRMDEERARLKLFDEENQALGDPLIEPVKGAKEGLIPGFPSTVFLRAPKWIRREPQPAPYVYKKVQLYLYPGTTKGYNLFVASNRMAGEKEKEQEKEKEGKLLPEEFKAQVWHAVAEYYRLELRHNLQFSQQVPEQKVTMETGPGKLVNFTLLTGFDERDPTKSHLSLWHVSRGWGQAAFVFQVPRGLETDPRVMQDIRASLKSSAVDVEAYNRREEYEQRMRR